MADSATVASTQSRSNFEVSKSRNNRIKNRAEQLKDQHLKEQAKNQGAIDQQRPMVRDDDDNDVRPQPINDGKKKVAKIGVRKPGATVSQSGAQTTSQVSGDSRDRRQSMSFNETSQGGGSSHDRSVSRAERSSDSGNNETSGFSDDTGNLFGDDSSDSHSTWGDRSSDTSSFYNRHTTSQLSSDAGYRQGSSAMGDHQSSVAAGGGGSGSPTTGATGGQRRAEFPLLQKPWITLFREPREYTREEKRAWEQEEVLITLTETPVIHLYAHNDELVDNNDSEEALTVKRSNARYREYCASRRDGESGGRYATAGVTTLNNPVMCELDEAATPRKVPSGPIQVYPWKLYDALERTAAELAAAAAEEQGVALDGPEDAAAGGEGDETGGMASDDEGEQDNDGDDAAAGGGAGGQNNQAAAAERKKNAWKRSATLAESLMVVERCVVQTIFDELQVLYRGLPYDRLTDVEPIHMDGAGGNNNASNNFENVDSTQMLSGTMAMDSPSKGGAGEFDATKRGLGSTKMGEGGGLGTTMSLGATAGVLGATTMHNLFATQQQNAAPRDKVKVLWRFSDKDFTAGRTVSCMSTNRVNPDIIAAGYNSTGAAGVTGSAIACWSLKNPTAPERVIYPSQGDATITTMHFGKQNGSLLAVGTTDGVIALYDVRKHGNTPALKSSVGQGQHTGTIWEVRWVERGKDRNEALVSISADGWVKEWAIKKGLEHVGNLIRLKRVVSRDSNVGFANIGQAAQPQPTGKGAAAAAAAAAAASQHVNKATTREALLARQSGGMCIDMNPNDPMLYVVGTEDGTISKCTKSKDDNSILDYKAHAEPVYRARWSPFNSDYFITCSADWTSRLYHIDRQDPVVTFDSNRQDPVQDFAWSPHCSTLFACATAGGRVELWDVADQRAAKTVFAMSDAGERGLTSVLFAEQESPVLLTGDTKGDVTVLKLSGLEFERNMVPDMEQSMRLHEVVKRHQL